MKLALVVVVDDEAMFHIHDAECPDLSRQKYEPSSIHIMDMASPETLIASEIEAYTGQGQDFTEDDFKVFPCCLGFGTETSPSVQSKNTANK
jgi:hypothetical protein